MKTVVLSSCTKVAFSTEAPLPWVNWIPSIRLARRTSSLVIDNIPVRPLLSVTLIFASPPNKQLTSRTQEPPNEYYTNS